MADDFKFRIDHHGSLVRPASLVEARRRWFAGAIELDELRTVEDEAILEAVRLQTKALTTMVTDGEFRREDLRSAVFDAVGGFRRTGQVDAHGRECWVAEGDLKVDRPLVADHASFLAEQTWLAPKVTLPSPAWLAGQCFDPDGPWRNARELGEELARILREEIELLLSRGVRLVQLDNPAYAQHLFAGGTPVMELEDCLALDTAAVSVSDKPEDARIALCPTHKATRGVDDRTAARVFTEVPVDRWVLPYNTGAAGELQLLQAVPAERDACLGVVDPTTPELEEVETILDRIDAAAEVKDLDDMAVSPSQGFSPVAGQASLNVDDQRRKLVRVETIARMCWGNEL